MSSEFSVTGVTGKHQTEMVGREGFVPSTIGLKIAPEAA